MQDRFQTSNLMSGVWERRWRTPMCSPAVGPPPASVMALFIVRSFWFDWMDRAGARRIELPLPFGRVPKHAVMHPCRTTTLSIIDGLMLTGDIGHTVATLT